MSSVRLSFKSYNYFNTFDSNNFKKIFSFRAPLRVYGGSDVTGSGWSSDQYTQKIHPEYLKDMGPQNREPHPEYDIGMIVLNTPIDWEEWGRVENRPEFNINTICLPKPEDGIAFDPNTPLDNREKNATFFGWGDIENNSLPRVLRRVDVSVKYEGLRQHYFNYKNPKTGNNPTREVRASHSFDLMSNEFFRATLAGV